MQYASMLSDINHIYSLNNLRLFDQERYYTVGVLLICEAQWPPVSVEKLVNF